MENRARQFEKERVMLMYHLKKKGFTLIELLITIVILSIVTSAIGYFFISNYKANNYVKDELVLQNQGEEIMSFITEKFMEGSGICIVNNEINVLNSIAIQTIDSDGRYLEFCAKDKKLEYGECLVSNKCEDDKTNYEITKKIKKGESFKNVQQFTITLIPISNNSERYLGIKFEIEVGINKMSKKFKSEVYFRNN